MKNISRLPQKNAKGFALLIAIVLSVVAVSITLAVTTLAYKGLLLSSAARESQYAFYAADTALECALFWDNGQPGHNKFAYSATPTAPTGIECAGVEVTFSTATYQSSFQRDWYQSDWFAVSPHVVNGVTQSDCARITIYKRSTPDANGDTGFLYGDGTNVGCSDLLNPRAVERGLKAYY